MAVRKVNPVEVELPVIFYEDPEPLEDGMLQSLVIFDIAHMLTRYYDDDPEVFVSTGGFVFYDITDGRRRVAPELYIAFNVDAKGIWDNLPSYWMWEVGKPPDFALEVASPSTSPNDLGNKRDLYARLGITEYWRLDPTGGELYGKPLEGERLVDGEFRPFELHTAPDGTTWAHSEVLGVRFHYGEELPYLFDVRDPETGLTIAVEDVERRARLATEDALAATQDTLLTERMAAEEREREMRAEIERLRRLLEG